jgi:transposase InsO family protein
VDPESGRRLYYYTVIDLYTRMTHVILAPKLSPGLAAQAVLEARDVWGFPVCMVQADNGPEYGHYFEQVLRSHGGITTRHTRLHRPNDNAHIERFNRTLQTEAIGYYWRRSVPLPRQRGTLTAYLDYYNTKRVHLGIQMRVPADVAEVLSCIRCMDELIEQVWDISYLQPCIYEVYPFMNAANSLLLIGNSNNDRLR